MDRLKKIEGELGKKEEFRYTTDGGCLTLEQRRFYEENGYIVIRGFLKDDDIERWKARFLDYCDQKMPPYPSPNPVSPECKSLRTLLLLRKTKAKI